MKTPLLTTKPNSIELDAILLMIRVVMGSLFINMGWPKIQQPMNWMGPDSGFPGFFLMLAAIAEFVGGIALVLGFLTRVAAFGIGCNMVVATYMAAVVWKMPFVDMKGGPSYYTNLLLLGLALLFIVSSSGRFSVDRIFFGVTTENPVI
jgi:putative oxidoreductase